MSLPFRQSLNPDEVCLCCSVSPAFANVSQESDPKPRDAYIDELLKEPLHYRWERTKIQLMWCRSRPQGGQKRAQSSHNHRLLKGLVASQDGQERLLGGGGL